ncbi:MAG: hypothetical protein ABI263_00375 [Gelidibacter sp.]
MSNRSKEWVQTLKDIDPEDESQSLLIQLLADTIHSSETLKIEKRTSEILKLISNLKSEDAIRMDYKFSEKRDPLNRLLSLELSEGFAERLRRITRRIADTAGDRGLSDAQRGLTKPISPAGVFTLFSKPKVISSITPSKATVSAVRNTDLDAPYSGGNFDYLYDGSNFKVTFVAFINFKKKFQVNEKATFIYNLKKAVENWNNSALIDVLDEKGKLLKSVSLNFNLLIVSSKKQHFNKEVEVHPMGTFYSALTVLDSHGKDREIVMKEVNVGIKSSMETLTHEMGHVYGLEDEYNSGFVDRFNPASPRRLIGDEPKVYKDKKALMNNGDEFRTRYFLHFAREIIRLEYNSHYVKKEIMDKSGKDRITDFTYGNAKIRLIKNDIMGSKSTISETVKFLISKYTYEDFQFTDQAFGYRDSGKQKEQHFGEHLTISGDPKKY